MREFIEKRTPLADQRLLTQMAYLFAGGWEIAHKSGNRQMQGLCARGLLFIDQTAIDAGRTNLSWLLAGMAEPQYSIVHRNRTTASLAPFSRLAQPSWISANVAYLKDLDFLESRIKTSNQFGNRNTEAPKEGEEEKNPKRPWKPKKKPKGGSASESAAN